MRVVSIIRTEYVTRGRIVLEIPHGEGWIFPERNFRQNDDILIGCAIVWMELPMMLETGLPVRIIHQDFVHRFDLSVHERVTPRIAYLVFGQV